jgi:hypothetical protein
MERLMPDFTVIDGGGKRRPPEDFDAQAAQQALRMMAVEILRAMVRGDDEDGRVERSFARLNEDLGRSRASVSDIFLGAIEELNKRLNPKHDQSSLSIHIDRIVRASLRVAAEGFCDDNAAAGRRSGRENELFTAIESFNRWHDGRPRK